MAKFVNVNGVGEINPDHVVMIVTGQKNKYQLVLSHGGRIEVTKTVRDKILKAHDIVIDAFETTNPLHSRVIVGIDQAQAFAEHQLDKDADSTVEYFKCQSCGNGFGTFAGKDERGKIYLCDKCMENELKHAYEIGKKKLKDKVKSDDKSNKKKVTKKD
jgi:hypothetical protein